jgi:glycosyltransferase involved in cell wall biosynthesis
MKISVVVPTYNSAPFIRATLDSVLQQTIAPDEILVLDDGSTDDTVSILNSYKPRVTISQQQNKGVASARNALCNLANGDLIAFLDHDDIWHPKYLEIQRKLFTNYLSAAAFFTGHVNFSGHGSYNWGDSSPNKLADIEIMSPSKFIERYNRTTGDFASMSYCCIPKKILTEIGPEPFRISVSGADDFYLLNLLPLVGAVVYSKVPLVAYRIIETAQSENRIKSLELALHAFKLLEIRYREVQNITLFKAFKLAFASKRRHYAKILMGAGMASEARKQFWSSAWTSRNLFSIAKSFSLLFMACMPGLLQPRWLPNNRKARLSIGVEENDVRL